MIGQVFCSVLCQQTVSSIEICGYPNICRFGCFLCPALQDLCQFSACAVYNIACPAFLLCPCVFDYADPVIFCIIEILRYLSAVCLCPDQPVYLIIECKLFLYSSGNSIALKTSFCNFFFITSS